MPRYEDDDRPRKRRPRDDGDDDYPRKRRYPDDQDDDRPSSARRKARRDDEDDYEDRPRKKTKKKAKPRAKEMSPLGLTALIVGILALAVSILMPCIASWSLILSGGGIVLSFIALAMAQKSDGRYGPAMPITGVSLSGLAVLIAVGWLVLGKKIEKEVDKMDKEFEAQEAKSEAERKKELAKAAGEVQAAGSENVLQVTAGQFAKAYEDDEDQADAIYKNKVIEVTGTVDLVDVEDEPYAVVLKAGRVRSVDCNFAKSPEVRARLAQLQPGQTVRIRGKCLGESATLEGCVLVE